MIWQNNWFGSIFGLIFWYPQAHTMDDRYIVCTCGHQKSLAVIWPDFLVPASSHYGWLLYSLHLRAPKIFACRMAWFLVPARWHYREMIVNIVCTCGHQKSLAVIWLDFWCPQADTIDDCYIVCTCGHQKSLDVIWPDFLIPASSHYKESNCFWL